MRGHQPLVAMRMRGVCPKTAVVHVGLDPLKLWRDWASFMPQHPSIEVPPTDRLSALAPELRCLVGLTVMVDGEDLDRTWAVAELCAAAEASRVIAMWHAPKPADSHGIWIDQGDTEWRTF